MKRMMASGEKMILLINMRNILESEKKMTGSVTMNDTLTNAITRKITGHAGMKTNVAVGIMTGGNGMMRADIMTEMIEAMISR